jgi:hypothetical protein
MIGTGTGRQLMSDLNRLLDTALELPSEQRESWLARHRRHPGALRGELRRSGEYIAGYIFALKDQELHRTPVYAEVAVALGRVELELGNISQGCTLFREAESAWNELNPRSSWAREVASLLVRCRK